MAKSIDIDFFYDATATCSNCGSIYTLGLPVKSISLDVCGNCHPFYTGQEIILDTAGRIEKFQARLAKTQGFKTKQSSIKKAKVRKIMQSLADLQEEENPQTPKNLQQTDSKKAKELESKTVETKEEETPKKEVTV
jgi:large subunit ribosomal protein L31